MGVSSCNSKKAQEAQKPEIETSSVASSIPEFPKLTGMEDIDYSVKTLLDGTVTYLKTKSEYKDLYTDKKFVIYIDEENIDYISSLSIQERKDIINSILREQDDIRLAKREYERRKKLVVHLLIGIITFVICIPLLYAIVNTCLEATIDNYKRSQYNFEVLYKERGKIKSTQTQH